MSRVAELVNTAQCARTRIPESRSVMARGPFVTTAVFVTTPFHSSNTTCLTHVFLKRGEYLLQTMVILDTVNSA